MEKIECWGCLRKFDKSQMRWLLPFAGGAQAEEGNVIQTYAAVTEEPQPGAVPYCPECLKGHVNP